MERLTTWNGKKWTLPQGKTADGQSYWRIIAERLAAYENTGYEPNEIEPKPPVEAERPYKYLVIRRWDTDDEELNKPYSEIMTAAQIFKFMDMEDTFPDPLEMDIYRINETGIQPTECTFRGTWHDPKDPLKMVIVGDGIRETGYGTDH